MELELKLTRRDALLGGGAAAAAGIAGLSVPAWAAAPLTGPATPGFYRVKLGEFEVTSVTDGFVQLDGPQPIFAEGQPEADVAKLMADNLLPAKRMEISFTPVIVNTGKQLILFDTGNGAGQRATAGKLVQNMAAAGFKPENVDIVVLTHCHGDHIGGLMAGDKPVFPNARYVIGEAEYQFWSAPERLSGATEQNAKLVAKNVTPLKDKMTFIKPGGEVAPGVTAVEAFGHTPGHLAFNIESGGKRLFAWMDSAHHPVISLQQPDWTLRFDMDKDKAAAVRKRIYDMAATDKTAVHGFHMPLHGFGFVEKTAAAYRWVPATYQLTL
ncbi:MAG: MBL fold metallo-hydrolase [Hyphomicrobiales bacterium]|nr:MBL fold metallo-hydrolase [Hyphomicrobiales bacterium]